MTREIEYFSRNLCCINASWHHRWGKILDRAYTGNMQLDFSSLRNMFWVMPPRSKRSSNTSLWSCSSVFIFFHSNKILLSHASLEDWYYVSEVNTLSAKLRHMYILDKECYTVRFLRRWSCRNWVNFEETENTLVILYEIIQIFENQECCY